MEKHIKDAKKQFHKDELAHFEFKDSMKMKVLEEIHVTKNTSIFYQKAKRVFPVILSAALITLFFSGLYTFFQNSLTGESNANHSEMKKIVDEDNDKKPPSNAETNTFREDNQVEIESGFTKKPETNIAQEKEDQIINNKNPPLSKEPDFISILINFENKMKLLSADDQFIEESEFKYKNYSTKQELYNELTDLASQDVIERVFHFLLEERPDGLYLLPQCSTFNFDLDSAYNIVRISDTKYQFSQYHLFYQSNIEITIEKLNNKWIIEEYSSNYEPRG